MKKRFKPEFLNRIDEIVAFNPLSKSDCVAVCDILLDSLAKRLAGVDITFSSEPEIADVILSEGYSLEYGARNLKRAVSEILEDAISETIIEGTIRQGDSVTAFVNEYGFIDFSVSR
ncbi:MAG: ATP-dependent Clp protease ATP-binding subunit [Clostridia bacterium]|nr:ATP-dependent Clp protease ATP-binding subunit [Clostridia bacterium]